MKKQLLFLTVFFAAACNLGRLPDKDLGRDNIRGIALSFEGEKDIHLDEKGIDAFCKLLEQRETPCQEPDNCYYITLDLKDAGSISYRTDGICFVGSDDTVDRPYCFKLRQNVLTSIFGLRQLLNCDSAAHRYLPEHNKRMGEH